MPTNYRVETKAPTIIIPTEKETIQLVLDRKKKIQEGRSSYEKQWLINVAFLYGKHYFAVDKRPISGIEERIYWEIKNLERKKKTRRVANYILPLYRSLLARMLMMKAQVNAEPTTNSERDIATARVSQEVLEDFWQEANKNNPLLCQQSGGMILVLRKLFSFLLSIGRGYLKPYFNPSTTAKAYLNDQIVEGEIGEVETKILSVLDVFVDPMRKYLIEQNVMPIDDIKRQYNIEVEKEDIGLSELEQQLHNLIESQSNEKYEDSARVYEMWEIPTTKHPQGRYIIATNNKLILDEGIPPEYKNRIPYFAFDYLDLMLSSFPQGMVEQLISLQEEYNFTVTRLAEYKKWFAGKLKVPKNCKLETKYDDEIGQIIKYDPTGGEPKFETPPPPPAFLSEDLLRIRRDMEDIAAVHDSTKFQQAQIRSGTAIENLNEIDNSQIAPVILGIEQQLAFFCEMVLDIMQAKYTEPRILSITGDTLGADVNVFKGEQLQGNRRIKISLGSSMPQSKSDRQALIMLLADKGYITKQKALELMEFGQIEGVFHSVDEQAAKSENQEMLKGTFPEPMPYDDHTIHLAKHQEFMKSKQYKLLPQEIIQLFTAHQKGHQDMLMNEIQASQQVQGQPPQTGGQ
uniref:Putative portal protein n=1 Tax=viral metagenome TaxID=1070528 RepID=A0A6H1ZSI0_9ZZZZ